MQNKVGHYRGYDYKLQRISDWYIGGINAYWFFTFKNGKPTGDSFSTLAILRQWVDTQYKE